MCSRRAPPGGKQAKVPERADWQGQEENEEEEENEEGDEGGGGRRKGRKRRPQRTETGVAVLY